MRKLDKINEINEKKGLPTCSRLKDALAQALPELNPEVEGNTEGRKTKKTKKDVLD